MAALRNRHQDTLKRNPQSIRLTMQRLHTPSLLRAQSPGHSHALHASAGEDAFLKERRRHEVAIDAARDRILNARNSNVCYLPPRPNLEHWYARHPYWMGTPHQIAVFWGARAIAMASAGHVLTGAFLQAAFNGGERPVAVEALAGETLTRQTALSLYAINLLPPFAEQLYAGGRLASSPSCAYASHYFERFIVSEVRQPPCIQHQKQIVVLEHVCALAAAHRSETLEIASVLIAEGTPTNRKIEEILLSIKPTYGAIAKQVDSLVLFLLEMLTNECFPSSAAEEQVH